MADPLVSVVTPSFNVRPFLAECLASVASQTMTDFEHLVMDGGSTDGTVELLEAWSGHHVDWVSEPDRGQSHAVNKGLDRARGNIVAWLNGDDLYEPWALARVAELFARDGELDLIYGFALMIDAEGRVVRMARHPRPRLEDIYLFTPFLHQPSVFFRRRVVDRFGGLDEGLHYAMDYEYWLRIGRNVKALFAPEIFSRIRHRPGSKMDDPGFRAHYRAMRKLYLANGGRRFSPMLLERLLDRIVAYPAFMASWPLRRLLWKAMGVPWGEPLRLY